MPVYKAHDTIKTTLHSVAMQRHIDFNVYLVVDGEPKGSYDYLLDLFPEINITYLDINGGPGVARQYAIDHSHEPFMSFIDADDTYLSSMALYYQHEPFKDDKIIIVSCDFLQENQDKTLRLKENDMVWMHGKMYRRAFLDKYKIRFNETRMNEDVGFNTQVQCFANENEQIYLSKDNTYMWQWRDGSIVRANDSEVAYTTSIDGYVINKIYAFNQVLAVKEMDDAVKYYIISAMGQLFKKYLGAILKAPKQVKHINQWSRKFYREMYKLIDKDYITKAQTTALAQIGFKKQDAHDEFNKWLKKLGAAKAYDA